MSIVTTAIKTEQAARRRAPVEGPTSSSRCTWPRSMQRLRLLRVPRRESARQLPSDHGLQSLRHQQTREPGRVWSRLQRNVLE